MSASREKTPHIAVEIRQFYYPDNGTIETLQVDAFIWGVNPSLIGGEQPSVLSLEPFVTGEPSFEDRNFFPNLVDVFRWQGNVYAIPADVNVAVMYYNCDLFDARGVAYPKEGWDLAGLSRCGAADDDRAGRGRTADRSLGLRLSRHSG